MATLATFAVGFATIWRLPFRKIRRFNRKKIHVHGFTINGWSNIPYWLCS
jgi:hypothetical protein